jgi:hypothetical protein
MAQYCCFIQWSGFSAWGADRSALDFWQQRQLRELLGIPACFSV